MGITRALRELNPAVRVVGVEPFKGHKIQGLKNMKESYPPGIFKPDELRAIVNVDDDSAYETARRLAREEGIFVGMSAGAAMKVAMDEARALGQGHRRGPAARRRRAVPLHFAVRLRDRCPSRCGSTTRCRGKVEQLEPVSPGKVTIYSCGPSLDGPPDLGLCRRVVFSDVLRRYLECRGYQVKHAMNLGDIDDRTVNECLKAGEQAARSSPPAGRRSSSKAWTRCASSGPTTIPGPASTSATWSSRPAACWKRAWPTRNCARSTSASAVSPTTASCRGSSRSRCGARPRRPTTTTRRTTPATSPSSSARRWRS